MMTPGFNLEHCAVSGDDLVVSPFVRMVPTAVVERFCALPARQGLGALLRMGDYVLLDEVAGRLILVEGGILRSTGLDPVQAANGCEVPEPGLLAELRSAGLVMARSDIGTTHAYRSLEIEVNTHCNFRCRFCPVHTTPKPRRIMTQAVYETVIEKARAYGIAQVSLNHYSEPTLDPNILQRIIFAAEAGMTVELYTNGSRLNPHLLDGIAAAAPDTQIIANLPSADGCAHADITGTACLSAVVGNLKYAFGSGLSVTVAVNAPFARRGATVREIQALFGTDLAKNVVLWDTDDRAGHLADPLYAEPRCHQGPLGGCILALQDLNVSVDGEAFLCAQDYNKEYVLGDLREQSVRDVVESDRARCLREAIFGVTSAPSDLICRRCAWTLPREGRSELFAVGNERKLSWDTSRLSDLLAKCPVIRVGPEERVP